MNKPRPTPDVKIVHVMADGTRLDSIEGKVIPPSATEFYDTVVKILRNMQHKRAEEAAKEKMKGDESCTEEYRENSKEAV